MIDFPALALLELDSIALGIAVGDAMVKRSPVATIQSGSVQPGRYLVLVTGDVATVEEAIEAGVEIGQSALCDRLFLPNVHADVVDCLDGRSRPSQDEALGIIETTTIASAIAAADAGLKGADVMLIQLRLGDGLGGKGIVIFSGRVSNVEAAIEIGIAETKTHLIRQIVIPQLHDEMRPNIAQGGRFGDHFSWKAA